MILCFVRVPFIALMGVGPKDVEAWVHTPIIAAKSKRFANLRLRKSGGPTPIRRVETELQEGASPKYSGAFDARRRESPAPLRPRVTG